MIPTDPPPDVPPGTPDDLPLPRLLGLEPLATRGDRPSPAHHWSVLDDAWVTLAEWRASRAHRTPTPDPTGGYEPATDAHRPRVHVRRTSLTVPTGPTTPRVDRTADDGEAVVLVVRSHAPPLRLVLDRAADARVYLEDDEHGPGSSLLELDRDEVYDLAAGLLLLLGELDRAARVDLGGDPEDLR